jgi:hypothetical protein
MFKRYARNGGDMIKSGVVDTGIQDIMRDGIYFLDLERNITY